MGRFDCILKNSRQDEAIILIPHYSSSLVGVCVFVYVLSSTIFWT